VVDDMKSMTLRWASVGRRTSEIPTAAADMQDSGSMTTHEDALRVLVVADDPLVQTSLGVLLREHDEGTTIWKLSPEIDLNGAQSAFSPDLILWDTGWEPTFALNYSPRDERGALPLVVLLASESATGEALALGARGILPRDIDASALHSALLAVRAGLVVMHPQFTTVPGAARGRTSTLLEEGLTPRELEVIALLAEGLPNKLIASDLGISEHTVKFHVNAILNKLGVHSRTEAVTRAARTGLISL
jgi:DNA-binding NarL/FixJ family response regulator